MKLTVSYKKVVDPPVFLPYLGLTINNEEKVAEMAKKGHF
jgi:hypothetical protein